jgi:hypothetical protein
MREWDTKRIISFLKSELQDARRKAWNLESELFDYLGEECRGCKLQNECWDGSFRYLCLTGQETKCINRKEYL